VFTRHACSIVVGILSPFLAAGRVKATTTALNVARRARTSEAERGRAACTEADAYPVDFHVDDVRLVE